jgi:hypothetical protein
MGVYAAQLNALKKVEGHNSLGVALSKCPLSIEQVEQVSAAVRFGRTVHEGKELGTFMLHCTTIRTIDPFDWLAYLRTLWPTAIELHEGTRVFYKVKCPWLGPNPCFYIADNRTLVGDEEEAIRLLLRRDKPAAPGFVLGADWKKVEHDLIAIAIDNHDERIKRSTRKLHDGEEFGKFLEKSVRWVGGLADSDEFRFGVTVTGRDEASAESIATLLSKLRYDVQKELLIGPKDKDPELIPNLRNLQRIVRGVGITTHDASVAFELAGGVKLADLLPLLPKRGL